MLIKETTSKDYRSIFAILVLLVLLFPYLYISQYANPVTDDLTYAYKGKNPDFWNTFFGEYENWNGRYFSNYLVLINPITETDFTFYKFVPAIIILLTFVSLLYLVHQLTLTAIRFQTKIIFSLTLLLIYLQTMPIISEGIYWYTGAVTYQTGIISLVFILGMMVQLYNEKYVLRSKFLHCFLIILTLFISAGCNELSMAFSLFFLSILGFKSFRDKTRRNPTYLLLFAAFLFGCLVYFAPGNENRGDQFEEKQDLFRSLLYSCAQTIRFFTLWLSGGTLLIASLLYYPICKKISAEISLFKKSFHISPWTAFAISLSVIFIAAFLPYWSTGNLGQHRTMNAALFFFILAWFGFLTALYNSDYLKWENLHTKIKTGLFSILCMLLLLTANGWNVLTDLKSGKAKSYDDQMSVRYEKIRNMKGDLYLPLIENPPKTLFVLDLTDDPNHWQNRSYTVFFEKTEYLIYPKKKINR